MRPHSIRDVREVRGFASRSRAPLARAAFVIVNDDPYSAVTSKMLDRGLHGFHGSLHRLAGRRLEGVRVRDERERVSSRSVEIRTFPYFGGTS